GIVVYFFVSNAFRIGQQAFITHTMYKDKDGNLIQTTGRESAAPAKGFREQLREARDSMTGGTETAKSDTKRQVPTGTKTATKTESGSRTSGKGQGADRAGGSGSRPSRSAPSN